MYTVCLFNTRTGFNATIAILLQLLMKAYYIVSAGKNDEFHVKLNRDTV